MPDWLKNLRSFLSLDYRSLFILAVASWTITAIPATVWEQIGLFALWSQFRPWIFIIALLTSIGLISGGLFDLVKVNSSSLARWVQSSQTRRNQAKILEATSRVEREVLARYIADDTTTMAFEIRDGIVNGLISKGILYRSSQLTNPMSYDLDTNIQPWAWRYLKSHPENLADINPVRRGGRHHL
jgi:hypothetical protein